MSSRRSIPLQMAVPGWVPARPAPAAGGSSRRHAASGAVRSASGQPASRAEWGAVALVLLATAWLQRGSIAFGFFADDFLFLDQVRQRSLVAALMSPDPIGNFFRPLSRQVYFWVMSRVGNESPLPFHVANLVLFLVALVLFERIARRLLGAPGAIVGMAVVALGYSADVPLLWASGSQDLMAMTLALAALLLHVQHRRVAGAVVYGLALLCKETVLLLPVVALVLEPGSERPRRLRHVLPMGVAFALWVLLRAATSSLRSAATGGLQGVPGSAAAALLHLFQTAFGLEWGVLGWAEGWRWPSMVTLAGVVAAVAWIRHATPAGPARPAGALVRRGLFAGSAWAVCGALPVAAVAPIWSAYYYLFAMCGVALVIGSLSARAPRAVVIAAVVLLATLCARAGGRQEFATATGAWTTQSHVTRAYLERSGRLRSRLVQELRRARPTLPRNSTLFFSSVPSSIGWQVGDGPLVRWAYRDSSLRSYFLNQFSYARASRGPAYFFNLAGERVEELWRDESPYPGLARNMILDDHPECARDALRLLGERGKADEFDQYMRVWLEYEAGRPDSARALLRSLGAVPEAGPAPQTSAALAMVAAHGDTLRAIALLLEGLKTHPLDAGAHGLLSDLLSMRRLAPPRAEIEAYAARVLAPRLPWGWRRWAQMQIGTSRNRQASISLDRYFELGGGRAKPDPEARYWQEQLRRVLPGGDLAQGLLRRTQGAPAGQRP